MAQLSEILEAREHRTKLRLAFAERNLASISLSFNIPGPRKSDFIIKKAFDMTVEMLERFLLANRILINKKESRRLNDAAGDFYLVPIVETKHAISDNGADEKKANRTVKSICEYFEQSHELRRILDVDVVDENGNPISSGKAKYCYLCSQPAFICMREKKHSLSDLFNHIEKKLRKFIITNDLEFTKAELSTFATQALLYEISLSPKPGLVDRFGSGSHNDMDFFSFLNSTAALSPYWSKIVQLAFNHAQIDNDFYNHLIELREIGIEMEQVMRRFTGGVNTHKGAIFVVGMLVYVVAKLRCSGEKLSGDNISNLIFILNKDSLSDELLQLEKHSANGKKVIQKYGEELGGGVRREMAKGMPIVFKEVLPILENAHEKNANFLNSEKTAQSVLTTCLLTIISKNNDSNILHRADDHVLKELQTKAKLCLNDAENFAENYKNLCDFCINKNISPGGSADLLAAAIFVHQVVITFS